MSGAELPCGPHAGRERKLALPRQKSASVVEDDVEKCLVHVCTHVLRIFDMNAIFVDYVHMLTVLGVEVVESPWRALSRFLKFCS